MCSRRDRNTSGCRIIRWRSAPRFARFSAVAFFWRVLTVEEPIVDIRAFTDRNFGIGCLISFCIGIGLYGLTYMYPRYLAEVRGYSALMIGGDHVRFPASPCSSPRRSSDV